MGQGAWQAPGGARPRPRSRRYACISTLPASLPRTTCRVSSTVPTFRTGPSSGKELEDGCDVVAEPQPMTREGGALREVVRDMPQPCEQNELARRHAVVTELFAQRLQQPLLVCAPAAAARELTDDRAELAPPHGRAGRHEEVNRVKDGEVARRSSLPVHDAGGHLPVRRDEQVPEPVVAVPPACRQPPPCETAPELVFHPAKRVLESRVRPESG